MRYFLLDNLKQYMEENKVEETVVSEVETPIEEDVETLPHEGGEEEV